MCPSCGSRSRFVEPDGAISCLACSRELIAPPSYEPYAYPPNYGGGVYSLNNPGEERHTKINSRVDLNSNYA